MEENATNTIDRDSSAQNEESAQQQSTGASTKRGSIIVVAVLLVLALVGFLVSQIVRPSVESGAVAKITVGNEVVHTMPLSAGARYVVQTDAGTNTVVVEDGYVHIEDADCAGGDCMKQGAINQPYQLLVCLPHSLIVEIEANETDAGTPSVYTGNETVGAEGSNNIDVVAH